MATSFTYATLKTAIKNFVEDQGTDFDANVDAIIGLGEDRCVKDLDLEQWYVEDTTKTIAQGDRTLTLPTGSLRVGDIFITTSGTTKAPLIERTYSYLRDYAPGDTPQARPKFWAPFSETAIAIAPASDASYAVTMKHLKRPAGLASGNTTTWLGTNLGDLLLYACLINAELYGVNDERIPAWTTEYQRALAAALVQFRNLVRRDYAPVAAQPTPKTER